MRRTIITCLISLFLYSFVLGQRNTEGDPGSIRLNNGTTKGLDMTGGGNTGGLFPVPFSGGITAYSIDGTSRLFASGSSSFANPHVPFFGLTGTVPLNNSRYFMRMTNDADTSGDYWRIGLTYSDLGTELVFRYNETNVVAKLTSNGIWQNSSDRRLKENIKPLDSVIQSLMKIKASRYNRKTSPDQTEYGFIAQEIEKIYPEIVSKVPNGDGEENYLMSYTQMIPILTKGMQEQQELINQQNILIKDLQKRMEALEKAN